MQHISPASAKRHASFGVALLSFVCLNTAIAGNPTSVIGTPFPSLGLTSPGTGQFGAIGTATITNLNNGVNPFEATITALSLGGTNQADFNIVGGTCAA